MMKDLKLYTLRHMIRSLKNNKVGTAILIDKNRYECSKEEIIDIKYLQSSM